MKIESHDGTIEARRAVFEFVEGLREYAAWIESRPSPGDNVWGRLMVRVDEKPALNALSVMLGLDHARNIAQAYERLLASAGWLQRLVEERGEWSDEALTGQGALQLEAEDLAATVEQRLYFLASPAADTATGTEMRCLQTAAWFRAATDGYITPDGLKGHRRRGNIKEVGTARPYRYDAEDVIKLYPEVESMIRDAIDDAKNGIILTRRGGAKGRNGSRRADP